MSTGLAELALGDFHSQLRMDSIVVTDIGDEPLTYCYRVLVPIWERCTDGNPSMRRALDCANADPRTHQERCYALMAVILQLLASQGRWASPPPC